MGKCDNETNSCRYEINNNEVYMVPGKQVGGMPLQTNRKSTDYLIVTRKTDRPLFWREVSDSHLKIPPVDQS